METIRLRLPKKVKDALVKAEKSFLNPLANTSNLFINKQETGYKIELKQLYDSTRNKYKGKTGSFILINNKEFKP